MHRWLICLLLASAYWLLAAPSYALTHAIDYTATGFSPASILIKLNDSVHISNRTDTDLALINTQLSGRQNAAFRLGTIPAQSYLVSTPTARGTYTFQNRENTTQTLTVQVTDRASLVAYYSKLHESAIAASATTSGSLLSLPVTLIATNSAASPSANTHTPQPETYNSWQPFLISLIAFFVYLVIFVIFVIKG